MKGFLSTTVRFLLPLFVGVILLFALPIDKRWGFRQMEEGCRNGSWLYERMQADAAPIDIAFLGSSRTMCSVNEALLEAELLTASGQQVRVANLGFCRLGRTLHYALAKELLKHKRPRLLVIEVRENEDRFSHSDFPLVADPADLLFPTLLIHHRYGKQVLAGIGHRFRVARASLWGQALPPDTTQQGRLHSFLPTDPQLFNLRDAGEIGGTRPLRDRPTAAPATWGYELNNAFPRSYLRRIADLAEANGVQICFLYLPQFHSSREQLPLEMDFYRQIGPVWVPPAEVFSEPGDWSDDQHLNSSGAEKISHWLVGKLQAM